MIYTVTIREKGTDNEISRDYSPELFNKAHDMIGLNLADMELTLRESKKQKF